jgi:hypothetical protein
MDPLWTECAYCKADAATPGGLRTPLPPRPLSPPGTPPLRSSTVVESDGGLGALPPRPTPTPPAVRQKTFVEGDPSASGLRPQVRPPTYNEDTPLPPRPASVATTPAAPGPSAGRKTTYGTPLPATPSVVTKARKIVGVLVTYSWRPEGKVYEIREGRNLIGRDPSCDVCVPDDETMSGVNTHITYRQNFVIGDMVSMMGTDLDGVPIEQQFQSLNSYAAIRAGSTHFTFIAVESRGQLPNP